MSEQDASLTDFGGKEPPNVLDLGPIRIEIPDEWETLELSNAFDLITGNSYTGDHLSEEDNGGRIFLTLKSVKKGGGFNWESIKYYSGKVNEREIVEPGELLIANTDVTQDGDVVGYSIRVPNFDSDKEIAASMDLSILRPSIADINQTYIEYLLQTDYIHSRMRAFSAGSTVLHLNTDLVGSLSLPLPPLEEQCKIASVLYTVDQAIQKTEAIISKSDRVREGVIQELFHHGIDEDGRLRSPDAQPSAYMETDYGQLPSDWELDILESIVPEEAPVTYGIVKPGDHDPNGVPLVKVEDIVEEKVDEDELFHVSHELHEDYKRAELSSGDLLFSIRGTVGRMAFVPESLEGANITQDTARIRIVGAQPEFIRYYFESSIPQTYLERNTIGQAVQGINLEALRTAPVFLPPEDEQNRIVQTIQAYTELIQKERNHRDQFMRVKQGLMQDLLSGDVRTHDRDIDVLDEVRQHG